jgi:RHS repeat-associated protein
LTLTYGPDGGLVNNSGLGGGRYLGAFLKQTDTNNWSARIIVQGRVIAVVKDSGGSVSTAYLLQGQLGSTAAVATGSGSLTRRIAYGAWGQFVHPATGTGSVSPTTIAQATTVTYTGHELIAGANLINMGARLYDPATGLFMSPDPTVAYPYNSQDLNQYAYVNDNPLSYVDPDGLSQCYTMGSGLVFCEPTVQLPLMIVTGTRSCGSDLSCIGGMLGDGMLQLYMTGEGVSGIGGGGGRGSTTAHSKQAKKEIKCTGSGRGLSGNTNLAGKQGGIPGQVVEPGTAAVIPQQFGVSTGVGLAPYASFIYGTIGSASFSGVTDVIGGKSPKPGLNVRTALQQLFPGQLILEIPGASDQGANAPVKIFIPQGLGECPTGTTQSGGG